MPDEEASRSVDDSELLYRSVRLREENFLIEPDGTLRLSSQAFTDRSREPSVFRTPSIVAHEVKTVQAADLS